MLDQASTFTCEEASTIAEGRYALVCTADELPSERDQNFLLTTQTGDNFILKIANATEQRALLEAQNDAMTHLASRLSFCPRVILNQAGEALSQVQTSTSEHFVRLVTFIPGVPLAKVKQTSKLLFNFGRRLGEFGRATADFDHPAVHRDFHWDLANGVKVIEEYSSLVADRELRKQVEKCRPCFDSNLHLPLTVIHGDANDHNVLVQGEDVVGLIDFGDMIYSYRVGELAIGLAYVVLDKVDPLMSARTMVAGYLSAAELNQDEIELIWPLMLTRLGMSICLAEHQRKQKPENEYLDVSQLAIRTSLPRLLAIDPKVVADVFLSADYADFFNEN